MEENEVITIPPQLPKYSAEEFRTTEPYQYLCDHFSGSEVALQFATLEMAENAKAVGFSGFKDTLKIYLKKHKASTRRGEVINTASFTNQPIELNCGAWECWDDGVFRTGRNGIRECACAHPILPIGRLRNIDTGEVKIKLAYSRGGRNAKWLTTIVEKATISTARAITNLATQGISVTSSTASALVDYLNDMENLNYDIIPERKSIGRLGYISDYGFSPYVEDLVFDGDASFRNLYNSVQAKGYFTEWLRIASECRAQSITAKIMLTAYFASPLLSIVGSLPFFVHLWGVDSGTGKTVALMLAASVWGNPAVGSYVQTFNGTQVGQERTAAFLNHLPMCLDELQLTKNSKGQSNFDVYQLAQGVGRSRGKKQGGVEAAPTWSCCFLTTGESPLTIASSGAGAVNRVIDIECTSGTVAIKDGHRVAGILKNNYGFAGEIFAQKLYRSEDTLRHIREVYQDFFKTLCAGDSTEKQAMAAAAILTADMLASMWIFEDDTCLTVQEISEFLASREAVSAGHRAYDWLCDWVESNKNHFNTDSHPAQGEIFGVIDGKTAYIIPSVIRKALTDEGYSPQATFSYLRSNKLIETSAPNEYTKSVRFVTPKRYVCLSIKDEDAVHELDIDMELL